MSFFQISTIFIISARRPPPLGGGGIVPPACLSLSFLTFELFILYSSLMYWYSVARRNLALRKTKKVVGYLCKSNADLSADDVKVPVNGLVSELPY